MFRIGQKVVCIKTADEFHQAAWAPCAFPKVGCIYHIRAYTPDRADLVLLVEIDNSSIMSRFGTRMEGAFPEDAFRPITDISIFTKMLKTENVDA